MSETPTPAGGNLAPVPIDPAERCQALVGRYLQHEGLGPTIGAMPFGFREEMRAVAATKPRMDPVTEYHWASACLELGLSVLVYQEPDTISDTNIAPFLESLSTFNWIANNPKASRFERARARIAAAAVPLYPDILRDKQRSSGSLSALCEKIGTSLKDMVGWYGKTGDPLTRRYINSMTAMGLLNMCYIREVQEDFVVTPIPSRFQEGTLTDRFSDLDLVLWLTKTSYALTRVGQRTSEGRAYLDPILLRNGAFGHKSGHTMGAAETVIETYGSKAMGPSRVDRNRFIQTTALGLAAAAKATMDGPESVHAGVPEASVSTSQEWYGAHPPATDISDRRTLKEKVNVLSAQIKSLSPTDVEMLGWMSVEMGGDAHRYTIAQQTLERAIGPYQEQGDLPKSFAASVAAIAAPLYGAIARRSPDLESFVADYRQQLADVATSILEWRAEESLDPAQASALDQLLQETTINLLLLGDGFISLPSSPRNRGEYVSEEQRQRHWSTTVFIADLDGAFSADYAARFRMGRQETDASLDECVFTVTPAMLYAAPGKHPLLQALIRESQGDEITAPARTMIERARTSLGRATRVANLV
jgi:hypothetical protein